ncbi:MAG: hypothetical protein FWH05_08705 [Oscillospiraceae bacterium]|nr:hypothetical protein [Oscillospiraceae bacterium]
MWTVEVETYKVKEDFELFYDDNALILEILENGTIPKNTATLQIAL